MTTGFFSVVMLNKKLSRLQWVALILLTAGVGIVQLQVYEQNPVSKLSSSVGTTLGQMVEPRHQNPVLGLVCVTAACVMSGFAGVYFEKLLKHTPPSIWLRNIQLSIIGIIIGLMMAVVNDGSKVSISSGI